MTPEARIQAAIEVLDGVLAGDAAEKALTSWGRRSRFAGSKDRAAVRDHVFQALRCRRSYACLGGAETGRGLMLGALRAGGVAPETVFTGQGHAPEVLSQDEAAGGAAPVTAGDRLDLPDWMVPLFEAALGDGAEAAARMLRERAPVCLRVNIRMNSVPDVIEKMMESGISVRRAEIAEEALIVTEGARKVAQSELYATGGIELQDGASQAAMASLEIAPGARVLDYCAGGGGKTLALAARHNAHWVAHDADPRRMADLPARAARAGVAVTRLEERDLAAAGPFDLVLCDVPCSGSGTWRRAPDAKWRLTPERLDVLCAIQSEILESAAALVAPGGQLVLTTCSVFRCENEDQSDGFLQTHPEWGETLRRRWPVSAEGDGFFLSVFKRI
ncbi:RsmB/NOP family class I SAM-dependent RNA methyltransferase [Roseovarius sp.]|jgi:16S rRNA (cytosine967-C5)-methyltransferase